MGTGTGPTENHNQYSPSPKYKSSISSKSCPSYRLATGIRRDMPFAEVFHIWRVGRAEQHSELSTSSEYIILSGKQIENVDRRTKSKSGTQNDVVCTPEKCGIFKRSISLRHLLKQRPLC